MPSPSSGHRRSAPFVIAGAAVAALALSPAASAAPATGSTGNVPRAAASVSRGVCTTSASDPQARAASFAVRVRDVPPASSYGFSVKLQERAPGARWTTLKGSAVPAGFGEFESAKPGAPRMSRRLNVQGLHPGSSYRLRVTYRWTGPSGVLQTTRTSRACAVKDLRPDVVLTGVPGWQPSTTGGEVAYRIGLRAEGLDALKGIDVPVVVRQGTTVLATGVVRPAAATEELLLPGRRCMQGSPVTVELDPDRTLADRVAVGQPLSAPCVPASR